MRIRNKLNCPVSPDFRPGLFDKRVQARMVIIYAFYPNRPEFMPVQARCFRRFLRDDYELRIVNSATSESVCAEIAATAADLSLPTLIVAAPDGSLPPSHAHAQLIHGVLRNQPTPTRDSIICLIDSDMFLLRDFSFHDFLEGYAFAGRKDRRGDVRYLAGSGILAINTALVPSVMDLDFTPTCIVGVHTDTGGGLYHYLTNHPTAEPRGFAYSGKINARNGNLSCLPDAFRDQYDDRFAIEVWEHAFLHYVSGSNWDKRGGDFHEHKWDYVSTLVDGCIAGTTTLPTSSYEYNQVDIWDAPGYPTDVTFFTRIGQDGRAYESGPWYFEILKRAAPWQCARFLPRWYTRWVRGN